MPNRAIARSRPRGPRRARWRVSGAIEAASKTPWVDWASTTGGSRMTRMRTMRRAGLAALGAAALLCGGLAAAEAIGEVDTVFKFIGPDHKIVVDAYDDPKVSGVTCYVSRAKTGGIKGAFGLAEDKAEASIACRQVGPISIAKPLPKQEEVFSERISLPMYSALI
eukprot:Opistho-1_new@8974